MCSKIVKEESSKRKLIVKGPSYRTPNSIPYVLKFERANSLAVCVSNICLIRANSVDPNRTPRSVASERGFHCLLRLVCLHT